VNGRETEMIVKVLSEVRNVATNFDMTVRAGSISRPVCIVSRQYSGSDTGMKFPIDHEVLFGDDLAARPVTVGFEQPKRLGG
jgi:hypothetical protein